MEHYRGYRVYCPGTQRVRIADTLAWFPDKVLMPGSTLGDRFLLGLQEMTSTLHDLSTHPSIPATQRPLLTQQTADASVALRALYDTYASHTIPSTPHIQRVDTPILPSIPHLPYPTTITPRNIPTHPPGLPDIALAERPVPPGTAHSQPRLETRPVIAINPSPYSSQPNTLPTSPAANTPTHPAPPPRRSDRVLFSTLNSTHHPPSQTPTSPSKSGTEPRVLLDDPLHPSARLNLDDQGRPLTFTRAM